MSVVLGHEPRRASINFAKSAGWVTGVAAIAVAFLAPYIWMVASSFKSQFDVFSALNPLNWRAFVPVDGSWANYARLFENGKVATGLVNSFLVACMQVGGALVMCTTTAYALSRIVFPGRRIVFAIILATFMLPTEAIVVPVYRVISGLGLQDTLIGIALPWLASAFGLLLVLPAFEEIPRELDEAARIDGAGHFRIFWNVILPNVKTALATLTLIIFLFSWNSFLWPLVVTSSPDKIVVQVAVAQSVSPGELPNWGLTFAGATAATIPLIILFLFLQKYFVQGLATSGMK